MALADEHTLNEGVGDAEVVLLPLKVVVAVMEPVAVPESVGLAVGVAEGEALPVTELVSDADPETLGDAPGGSGGVAKPDRLVLALSVELGVEAGVPELVGVGLAVAVPLGVCEALTVPLWEALPVTEADAPRVSGGVGEGESVELPLIVGLGVEAADREPVGVGVPELVGVGEGLADTVALREFELVLEGDAPAASDGAGEAEMVELALVVALGVTDAVAVPDVVPDEVGEGLGVSVPDPLLLNELLPVREEEAPGVSEDVGEGDRVVLPLMVDDGVGPAVPVPDAVALAEGVPLGDCDAVCVLLRELEGVRELDAPGVRGGVGVADVVLEPLSVLEGVRAAVLGPVPVGLPLGVGVGH